MSGAAAGLELDPEYAELLRLFQAEAEEGLQAMEQSLLALESRPRDDELLQTLFRVAHTLKGNAASLGLHEVAAFTHVLEDVLDRVRERRLAVTADAIGSLLAAVDALREMVPEGVQELR